MPTAAPLLPALLVFAAVGAAIHLYLRRAHRARLVRAGGIRALASMRWREFSQFVITALQAQGFDAHPLADTSSTRDPTDLLLSRDNRSWLLSCRQSVDYVVTAAHLQEMSDAVRKRSAAGGIIATLGRIDRSAQNPQRGLDVLDGPSLWRLIYPLLPQGLQDHVSEQADRLVKRQVALGWAGAAVLAVATAFAMPALLPRGDDGEGAAATPSRAASGAPAVPADPPATAVAPTLSEDQARQQVLDAIGSLPRVESVIWASKSTLLVTISPGEEDLRPRICATLETFENLRASRVQLQPTSGSPDAVRFFHCRLY